jgi:hypothetical protein
MNLEGKSAHLFAKIHPEKAFFWNPLNELNVSATFSVLLLNYKH